MNREDFPILNNTNFCYFDNGATTLKNKYALEKMTEYNEKYTSNIHRGDYDFATITNKLYDTTRDLVQKFVNAKSSDEIVFTKGTTYSLNLVVSGYMKTHLKKGDEVLISTGEHASNILPWLVLQKEIGIVVKFIPLDKEYSLTVDSVKKSITDKTKVISLAHITNVIGDIRDIDAIGEICKEKNIIFVVDAAQSAGHKKIDVQKSNISFLAFSSHKMTGPTGVGVLYGKLDLLNETTPLEYGGGMNQSFETDGSYILKEVPIKFEAGTPPIAEVIGLGETIKFLNRVGMDNIEKYEHSLKEYLIEELSKIDNIILYNKESKSGTVAFNIKDVFAQDTSIYLNHYNIYIRAGNHCAKVLKDDLKIKNTCRISLYFYNTKEEIDKLINALMKSKDIFKIVL